MIKMRLIFLISLLILTIVLPKAISPNMTHSETLFYESSSRMQSSRSKSISLKISSIQGYNTTFTSPFRIDSDSELNSTFPGRGTIDNPIQIYNLNITSTTTSPPGPGLISIFSTTFYFEINGCLVNPLNSGPQGIYLWNVAHGTIINTTIKGGLNGIVTTNSDFVTVKNSTITNSAEDGIRLGEGNPSHNNIILNNTISYNPWAGIRIDTGSENNSVENNTIDHNDKGIEINSGSNFSKIINNRVHNNTGHGLSIQSSINTTITDNSIIDNNDIGIYLYGSSNNSIIDNVVNRSVTQGINVETNFDNPSNPILSEGNQISFNLIANNQEDGIVLNHANRSIVQNNTVYDNPIMVGSSDNCSVINNKVYGDEIGRGGIGLSGSNYNVIRNNMVYAEKRGQDNGQTGISAWWSKYNTISENSIHTIAFAAIQLSVDVDIASFPAYNLISHNKIFGCKHGIVINSFFNNITENEIYNNDVGFYMNGNNNTLMHNVFYDNGQSYIETLVTGNKFSRNDFSDEWTGGSQIVDEGSNNIFSNNFWSDWSNSGGYSLDGAADNQDLSPLMNPFHLSAPVMTAPTYENLTLADDVTIQWTTTTDTFGHSLTYAVFYSIDSGVTWIGLVSELTATNYTLDTNTIDDGTIILLKIQAIDSVGFIARTISEETFLIGNSPHQLSIPSLIYPIGGETLSGDVTLSWSTSIDTWGYSVTYNVSYSEDGGETWSLLKAGLTAINLIWDTTTVSDGSNYILKIEAISAGELNTTFISSSPFTITNPTTTTTTTTSTTTTTTYINPSWDVLLLLLSLFVMVQLIQHKKKS
jgi:parallel beta-helix repeat protein